MKDINHLVIAARDLGALSLTWAALGFTLTPRGQHPFGTGNAVIQLHGSYLELLSVTNPQDVVEHDEGQFSFSAFNRDFLARHEGFSMLVLGTRDAAADIAAWRAAGLQTYAPFEFSRLAKMPSGDDVRVGFSLAFVSTPCRALVRAFRLPASLAGILCAAPVSDARQFRAVGSGCLDIRRRRTRTCRPPPHLHRRRRRVRGRANCLPDTDGRHHPLRSQDLRSGFRGAAASSGGRPVSCGPDDRLHEA